MRLTHNSLSTIIAWISSCLLAGGFSTLFSDDNRMNWLIWGSFGLVSAVGLDVAARHREKARQAKYERVATARFERELLVAAEESETQMAVREALCRILGKLPPALQHPVSRRSQERVPCMLDAEILLHRGLGSPISSRETCTRIAKITNLSDMGFEVALDQPVSPQRATFVIRTFDGKHATLAGEILWCAPQPEGHSLAGGRFVQVISVDSQPPASVPIKAG